MKARRSRLRLWLRLIFYPLFVAGVVIVLAACWVVEHFAETLAFVANRELGGYSLRIADAKLSGMSRVDLAGVDLRPRNSQKPLLSLSAVKVDFSAPDLWRHRIAGVEITGASIKIGNPLSALPGSAAKAPAETNDESALWQVGRVSIRSGKCSVDTGTAPRVEFDFSSQLKNVYLTSDTRWSREMQSLELNNIEVLSREPRPRRMAGVKGVAIQFTIDQLARKRVEEVVVTAPSSHADPELIRELSAAPASAKASAATAATEDAWRCGKLKLRDGEASASGLGPSVPDVSFKYTLDAADFTLGGPVADEKTQTAQLWDVRCAAPQDPLHPFALLDSLQIDFSTAGLGRKEIAKIETTGLWVSVGRQLRSLLPSASGNAPGGAGAIAAVTPWRVRDLSIQSGYIFLSEIGLGVPDLGIYLRTDLSDVALSADPGLASNITQTVELSDISIHSPLDPFVPVVTLKTIFARFSLAQLLRNEIEEISLVSPQIFVGEDLFWYADALKQKQPAVQAAPEAGPAPAPRWIIRKLGASLGEILITNGGKTSVALPMRFSWAATNLDFSNLDDVQLKLKLDIPQSDYRFPDYQLELRKLFGKIEFGLPPEKHSDNLVHTLQTSEIRWRQFVGSQFYFSVMYDKEGIYGQVGGAAYGGYLTGGFSFFTQDASPWTGWMSGTKVDLRGVTDVMAPKNIQMTGPGDFKLEVNGLNHDIQRMLGSFTIPRPGKLKVTKLDEVLGQLPAGWTLLKTSLTRIGLETLRDFDYSNGNGSFWFTGDRGELKLNLRGPGGSRNFDAVLHGAQESATLARRP